MTTPKDGPRSEPELCWDNAPAAFAALEREAFATPWREEDFRDGPDRFHLSLWRERRCMSFVYGSRILDEVEIWRIATLPDERAKGLGGRLLGALLEACRQWRTRHIFLEVAHRNRAARALYEKYGFREERRRTAYYGPGNHALILGLDLEQRT